jgi:hydroxymethylpyrimidine pyrophosphatase-like HAD family hydrolase
MTDRLSSPCEDPPWLVALDIDGNLLHEGGSISDAVIEQVRRLDEAGHQVMLATGRSSAATIPVLEHLAITPRFLVCSNGAITLHPDAAAPSGYRREWGDSFDPDRCAPNDPRAPGERPLRRGR